MNNQLFKLLTIYFFILSHILYAKIVYNLSLQDFVQKFPETTYIQCTHSFTDTYKAFPLYQEFAATRFPTTMSFEDIFILNVPQGRAYFDKKGYPYINNCFIKEMQIKDINFFQEKKCLNQAIPWQCTYIPGRVAIISHVYPSCYGLWFFDILSQLALLEIHNIDYDYLIIPYFEKFMLESLDLWGIDPAKIIPLQPGLHIQANNLIIPTSTSQTKQYVQMSNYYIKFLLGYVRNKLLSSVNKLSFNMEFPEKIFISRKDALGKRATPNEDEIFALFEPLGFKRFSLTPFSVAEKIALFHHAKMVVSFVGSGSTNIMFCKPASRYIEITSTMVESTFFLIASMFGLEYIALDASNLKDFKTGGPWSHAQTIPLSIVQDFLTKNADLLQ